MGGVVSREHAKLPFAYSHARQDHAHSAASTRATTKRRLASRLLLHRNSDSNSSNTTSVTPFPATLDDGNHGFEHSMFGVGPGGVAYGGGSITIGGLGGSGAGSHSAFGGVSTNNNLIPMSVFLESSPTRATFGHADVVSLSSMLDQGPESDFDPYESREGSLMDLEEALGAYVGGGGNANNNITGGDRGAEGSAGPQRHLGVLRDSDSGHERSIRSRSDTVNSIRWYGFPDTLSAQINTLATTTATTTTIATTATGTMMPQSEHPTKDSTSTGEEQRLENVYTETPRLPSLALGSDVELSKISILAADKALTTTIASHADGTKSSLVGRPSSELGPASEPILSHLSLTPPPKTRMCKDHQGSLASLSSWIAEERLDSDKESKRESDEEEGASEQDNDMDIISALSIADFPDRKGRNRHPDHRITLASALATTPPDPKLPYPRLSMDEEDCCVAPLSNNTSWMDQEEYENIVHIPQDFFGQGRHFQQGYGLDLDEQDPEDEDGSGAGARNHANMYGLGGARNVSYGYLGLNGLDDLLKPSVDEDVAHLSPIPFAELPSLTNIGLCNHGIVKLSANIRLLGSTTCLQLCCNDLCSVPAEIGYMRNLTLLDLSKNSLTSIPDSVQYLSKLVDLKLSFNFLESLPASLGQLTKLANLTVDNNRLHRIPPQIGHIKGLVTLELSDNPIEVLPAEIGRLQMLRSLKLGRCPLLLEFTHSPLHSPPTLLELAARVIVRHDLKVSTMLPSHLKNYLKTAQRCTFCEGPYFESSYKRGKIIEKNDQRIPLEYTLCHPHWNTEMERVRLLFCSRPVTAPPPPPPPFSTSTTMAGLASSFESRVNSRRQSKSGASGAQAAAAASASASASASAATTAPTSTSTAVVATPSSTTVAGITNSTNQSQQRPQLQQQHRTVSSLSSSSHWRTRSESAHPQSGSSGLGSSSASTAQPAPEPTVRSRASLSWIRGSGSGSGAQLNENSILSSSLSSSSSSFPTTVAPPTQPCSMTTLPPPVPPSAGTPSKSRFSLLMKKR